MIYLGYVFLFILIVLGLSISFIYLFIFYQKFIRGISFARYMIRGFVKTDKTISIKLIFIWFLMAFHDRYCVIRTTFGEWKGVGNYYYFFGLGIDDDL